MNDEEMRAQKAQELYEIFIIQEKNGILTLLLYMQKMKKARTNMADQHFNLF